MLKDACKRAEIRCRGARPSMFSGTITRPGCASTAGWTTGTDPDGRVVGPGLGRALRPQRADCRGQTGCSAAYTETWSGRGEKIESWVRCLTNNEQLPRGLSLHTGEVAGSIPAAPTMESTTYLSCRFRRSRKPPRKLRDKAFFPSRSAVDVFDDLTDNCLPQTDE